MAPRGQPHHLVGCIPVNPFRWEQSDIHLAAASSPWPWTTVETLHTNSPFSPSHFTTPATMSWSNFTLSLFSLHYSANAFYPSAHKSLRDSIHCLNPLFPRTRWDLASSVLLMTKHTHNKLNNPSVSYTERSIGQSVPAGPALCFISEPTLLHWRGETVLVYYSGVTGAVDTGLGWNELYEECELTAPGTSSAHAVHTWSTKVLPSNHPKWPNCFHSAGINPSFKVHNDGVSLKLS